MRRTPTVILLIVLMTLVSCRTAPPQVAETQEGQWKAKALVKDLDQSHSYIVNLNFNSRRNEVTRMDVTTTLGGAVASLLVDPTEVRYLLFDSKKFYSGTSQPGAMRPILAIPFDPRWLQNILFNIPISGDGWSCKKDAQEVLTECVDNANALKVTWSTSSRDKRTVLIEHPKATVQINFQSFQPKVEERKNLFALEPPRGFLKLKIKQ